MTEKSFTNSNPSTTEFVEMLGNPIGLSNEQIWALAHVFRCYVEGVARALELSESHPGYMESINSAKNIMQQSLLSPRLLGVNENLIKKAISLGVLAAPHYIKDGS